MSTIAAGLAQPTTTTAPRQPDSMRRTSHIDMIFDEGSPGSLRLRGHARDLHTDGSGHATILAESSVDALVDESRHLQSLSTSPAEPAGDRLLGLIVGP